MQFGTQQCPHPLLFFSAVYRIFQILATTTTDEKHTFMYIFCIIIFCVFLMILWVWWMVDAPNQMLDYVKWWTVASLQVISDNKFHNFMKFSRFKIKKKVLIKNKVLTVLKCIYVCKLILEPLHTHINIHPLLGELGEHVVLFFIIKFNTKIQKSMAYATVQYTCIKHLSQISKFDLLFFPYVSVLPKTYSKT